MYKIVENVYDSVISFILLLASSDFWKGTETVMWLFDLLSFISRVYTHSLHRLITHCVVVLEIYVYYCKIIIHTAYRNFLLNIWDSARIHSSILAGTPTVKSSLNTARFNITWYPAVYSINKYWTGHKLI